MNELIQTIKEFTVERLKNPLIPGFAIGWSWLNWKVLAILFLSDGDIGGRLELVQGLNRDWCQQFFLPLLIAVIYVGAMPWLAFIATYVQSNANTYRKRFQIQQEIAVIGARQEKAKVESELLEIRLSLENSELEIKVKRLQDRYDEYDVAINVQKSELEALKKIVDRLKGQGLWKDGMPIGFDDETS